MGVECGRVEAKKEGKRGKTEREWGGEKDSMPCIFLHSIIEDYITRISHQALLLSLNLRFLFFSFHRWLTNPREGDQKSTEG